jgi:thioesterase DpgC
MTAMDQVRVWLTAKPTITGDSKVDAVGRYLGAGRQLLLSLPLRHERDDADAEAADTLLAASRSILETLIGLHARSVYEELTDGLARSLTLRELVEAAAERFPGLLPSRRERDDERARPPQARDVFDLDVALFVRAILRDPVIGNHLLDSMRRPSTGAQSAAAEFDRLGWLALKTVTVSRVGVVAHVTLHNTKCLNAEDDHYVADLERAVDVVMLSESVRVGVLRGGVMTHPRYTGRRVFSAGINLRELSAGRISFVDFLLAREMGFLSKMARGLLTDRPALEGPAVHKPWLAVVDGFAIGGGVQIVLVADHVLAAEGAWFSLPAAQEGIVPGLADLRLPRAVGARLARRMILMGQRVTAGDVNSSLICDEVVPVANLDTRTQAVAESLGTGAVKANKRMLAELEETQDVVRQYLAEFTVVQVLRMHSPDVLQRAMSYHAR